MLQDVDMDVSKQSETMDDEKQKTLGKGEDHILLSVLTIELLMPGNKQTINISEKTPLCQGMEDRFEKQSVNCEYETLATIGREEDILASTRPIGEGNQVVFNTSPVKMVEPMESRVSLPYMDLASLYY